MTLWGIIELFHIKWIHPFRKYEICDELKGMIKNSILKLDNF